MDVIIMMIMIIFTDGHAEKQFQAWILDWCIAILLEYSELSEYCDSTVHDIHWMLVNITVLPQYSLHS